MAAAAHPVGENVTHYLYHTSCFEARARERRHESLSRRRERIERFHPERVEMPLVHGDHHRFARFGHSSNAQEIGNPLGAKSLFCELIYRRFC